MEVIRTGAAKMGDLRSDGVSPNLAKKSSRLNVYREEKRAKTTTNPQVL